MPSVIPSGEIVAALVTPCHAAGQVDPPAMTRMCRALVEHGCWGLFVASSTGQSTLLDARDRRALIVAARAGGGSGPRLYAGVSDLGVRATVEQARHAAADGADFAVIMAPLFFKIDQRQLIAYCSAIADESPLPVVLYHHPRMATPFEVDTVARLAEHPNIVGIKDTSVESERQQKLIAATAGTDIAILQGSEGLLLEGFRQGIAGSVTALASVIPEWHAQLFEAVARGDMAAAEQFQRQIIEVWKMFRLEPVSQSISAFSLSLKLGMRRRGWLDRLDDLVPGFEPAPSFESMIHDFLSAAGVPEGSSSVRDPSRANV